MSCKIKFLVMWGERAEDSERENILFQPLAPAGNEAGSSKLHPEQSVGNTSQAMVESVESGRPEWLEQGPSSSCVGHQDRWVRKERRQC
jgi:hypothetical protein